MKMSWYWWWNWRLLWMVSFCLIIGSSFANCFCCFCLFSSWFSGYWLSLFSLVLFYFCNYYYYSGYGHLVLFLCIDFHFYYACFCSYVKGTRLLFFTFFEEGEMISFDRLWEICQPCCPRLIIQYIRS